MKHENRIFKHLVGSRWCLSIALFCCLGMPLNASATVVEFQTSLGNFEVNLTDEATPETVANFLQYVADGDYINSVIHRSVTDFVVQGGGFIVDIELPLSDVPEDAPVLNEPVFSNVRGTIAMAKLPTDPNSATSQWFFNLVNNGGALDGQNGGFTVFGQVVGDGMEVVDAIAVLPIFNFGGALNELPLRDYTDEDVAAEVIPDTTNLVVINAIVITDAAVDTAAGLELLENNSVVDTSGDSLTTADLIENRASGLEPWLLLVLMSLLVWRINLRQYI